MNNTQPTADFQLNIYSVQIVTQLGVQCSDHELQADKTETVRQRAMAQCDGNTKRNVCSAEQPVDRYGLTFVSE